MSTTQELRDKIKQRSLQKFKRAKIGIKPQSKYIIDDPYAEAQTPTRQETVKPERRAPSGMSLDLQPEMGTSATTPESLVKPPQYDEPTLRTPDPKGIMGRAGELLKKPFTRSDEGQQAHDWRIYATSQVRDIPMEEAERQIEEEKKEDFKQKSELAFMMLMAGTLGTGAVTIPVLARGIATFVAVEETKQAVIRKASNGEKEDFADFLNDNTNEGTKQAARLIELLAEGALAGTIEKKALGPLIAKIKAKINPQKSLAFLKQLVTSDVRSDLKTIGLEEGASRTQVSKRVRELQNEFHPDKYPNATGEQLANLNAETAKINAAFTRLKKNYKPDVAKVKDITPATTPENKAHIDALDKIGLKWGASRSQINKRYTKLREGREITPEMQKAFDSLMKGEKRYNPYGESEAYITSKRDKAITKTAKGLRAEALTEEQPIEMPSAIEALPKPVGKPGVETPAVDAVKQTKLTALKEKLEKLKNKRKALIDKSRSWGSIRSEAVKLENIINKIDSQIEAVGKTEIQRDGPAMAPEAMPGQVIELPAPGPMMKERIERITEVARKPKDSSAITKKEQVAKKEDKQRVITTKKVSRTPVKTTKDVIKKTAGAKRVIKKEAPKVAKTYREIVAKSKAMKAKPVSSAIARVLGGRDLTALKKAVAESKEAVKPLEREPKVIGDKRAKTTTEQNVSRFKKAYTKELQEMKKAGKKEADFKKLYEKEFSKEVSLEKETKADVIMDFIENEYGFVSIKSLLTPIKNIETALNTAWEKTLTAMFKGSGAQGLASAIGAMLKDTALVDYLGRKFKFEYMLPEWYKDLKRMTESKRIKGEMIAEDFMKTLTKGLTQDEAMELHHAIINGGRHESRNIEARAMAARTMLDYYGEKYWKAGAISEETFRANKGHYMLRAYYDKELITPLTRWIRQGGFKAGLKQAKARGIKKNVKTSNIQKWLDEGWTERKKRDNGTTDIWRDFTIEERKAMNEIVDNPGYLVSKGIRQVSNDVAMLEMFESLTKYKDIVRDKEYGNFLMIPKDKKYGKLAGKYVDKYIYEDIVGTMEIVTAEDKFRDKFISEWKKFKVTNNPATHARNMYFNFMLSDIAGLSPTRVDVYGRALNGVIKRDDMYNEAKIGGLFGTTWSGAELQKALDGDKSIMTFKKDKDGVWKLNSKSVLDVMGDLTVAYNKIQKKVGAVYQAEEEWNKLALYIFAKEDLMLDKVEAVKFAKKWGLDYSAVTPAVQRWSKKWYGAPFIRFQIKAAPRLAEGAIKKPFTIAKWMLIAAAMAEASRRALGITEEEEKEIRRTFPEWMNHGAYILAPDKDKYGQFQFMDFSYIIPFVEEAKTGPGSFYNYTLQNPTFKIPAEIVLNKSAFTGREIYDETTNPSVSAELMAYGTHVYKSIAPNLAPWNYGFDKVFDAQMGKPDREGRIKSIYSALGDVIFGIKLRTIDVTKEKQFRMSDVRRELNSLENKMISVTTDQRLSKEEQKKEIKRLSDLTEKLVDKARELGTIDVKKLEKLGE